MSDDKKRTKETLRQSKTSLLPPGRGSLPSIQEWMEEEPSTRLTETTVAMPAAALPKSRTRALLTVISGAGAGRAYSLTNDETLLGRGREATVRLDDPGSSRLHAKIRVVDDGSYVLEDLQSTNGTFVGGRKVVENVTLKSGDRIQIGPSVSLSFAILDSQAEIMTHQLYESAMRDALTRAHNRRYFVERLESELAFARRHTGMLALILFDIDHFKQANDTFGHLGGDSVLREVAALVGRMIRTEDVFARYGGEEFVVLARGIEHANTGRFAERIRVAIERLETVYDGKTIRVTISTGYASLAELEPEARTAEGIVRLADQRLYKAKAAGRNRSVGA